MCVGQQQGRRQRRGVETAGRQRDEAESGKSERPEARGWESDETRGQDREAVRQQEDRDDNRRTATRP